MGKLIITLGIAALLLLPAAGSARTDPTEGSYRIGNGDVLDIIVWRNKELTMTVTVRPDGWISLPLVNDVRVEGLTPTQLQAALEGAFAKSVTSPMVTVIVTRVAGFKVSILGKVRQPGRYDVDTTTTVLDVLAQAGGPNDYADTTQMYVMRRGAGSDAAYQRVPVQYSSGAGKDNTNIPVRPGDIIIVP